VLPHLASLIRPELIFPELAAADRSQVLHAFADRIAGLGLATAEELFGRLWEREQLGSTGIGSGIAIPHCKLPRLARGIVAIGTVPGGVDFGAVDGKPVCLFFLVVSPSESPAEHLQVLAAISRWIKAGDHAASVLELREPQAIYDFLRQEAS
jgi:nitrogen PTS system EIIA component